MTSQEHKPISPDSQMARPISTEVSQPRQPDSVNFQSEIPTARRETRKNQYDVAIQCSKLSNSMATLHHIKIPVCQGAPSRLSPNNHWDDHAING